jgi:hypothetical protein
MEVPTMPPHKSRYFVPALSLLLLACIFTFDSTGVTWLWSDQPVVAVLLVATSAVFWTLLFSSRRRLISRG